MHDTDELNELALVLGGRRVSGGYDRLRRYCGLAWSGGPAETWAFRYYDVVPSRHPGEVDPVDVLATAALHPGLSQRDLAYFHDSAELLAGWLGAVPTDVALAQADDGVVDHLGHLADAPGPGVALLSKVLHRKRPHLLPLVDRHILDWYRPMTGQRAAGTAWRPLIEALRNDLGRPENRLVLGVWEVSLRNETGHPMSLLRATDIVLWTAGQWGSSDPDAGTTER